MPSFPLDLSLWIVGPGRAGRALGRSWIAAGGRTPLLLAKTREGALAAAAALPGAQTAALDAPLPENGRCDVLVLAVPDDAITRSAEALAPRVRCRIALHLSGVVASSALSPLAPSGGGVASLHPLRAFSGAPSDDWRGAFVAVEGDPQTIEIAVAIASAVGAEPHRIGADVRPLYHAGATLAAGGVVAVLSIAVRAWAAAGIPEPRAREALAGLAGDAVRAARERDFADAFTGAVARRDLGTIRAHRDALQRVPDALRLYAALAEETLSRTPGRGSEEEIRRMLSASEPSRR